MTDILCRWLNDELTLSHTVDPATFARDFSSGYLIGEILQKYQLQDDFDQFSQSRTSESKLNNFSRLEPVFRQLGVPFNMSVAHEVMTEKHGIATRLLYQLYIILNLCKKGAALGQSQDFGQSVRFNTIQDNKLREQARKRPKAGQHSESNVSERSSRFPALQKDSEEVAFRDRFLDSERRTMEHEQHRLDALERSRLLRAKQSEMVAKIKSSTMHVPKPPSKSSKFLQERQALHRKREAVDTVAAISRFEDKLKMILLPTDDGSDEIDISYILKRDEDRTDTLNVVRMSSNGEYIGKIRKRLQEDAAAREEREKRRRKVIGEQMSAHQAQEEARKEEMMVNKLMRQSQQERRVAVQLLQARLEKSEVRNKRISQEQQYQERRLREFEEAMDKEAELAHAQREEKKEEIQQAQELHDKISAQRAEERYRHHYDSCYDIVAQVVDFSCKVVEYRQPTENLLPAKLMRDWTAMFVSGHPLYEAAPVDTGEPTPEQILEEERQMLLDEGDFMEYKNMIGEWQPPEVSEVGGPPRSNPVVGHIIQRLYSIVHPPTPPPPPPEFPPFPIRACVLGKAFSGKTTVVKQLLEDHRVVILDADDLVSEAVEAHKNNEMMVTQEQEQREASASERPSADLNAVTEEGGDKGQAGSEKSSANQLKRQESKDAMALKPSSVQRSRDKTKDPNEPQPSVRNKLGSKAMKFLKKGRPVDDQIVVDILVDAIKRVPEGTGWVIDGYPQNYNQAKILEKALSGYDANAKENLKQAMKTKSRKSSLVPDPRPTPPPSEPTSGIDVVILFDIDDEVCIKRASEQPKVSEREEAVDEDVGLPTEGSASAGGRQKKAGSVSDPAGEQDQLQKKLTAFQDSWPKMDKWFTRFGTLKKVDAAEQPSALFLEVEKIMEDTVAKILGKDLESSLPLDQTEGGAEKAEDTPEVTTGEVPPEPPKETTADAKVSGPGSRSGSRAGSAKRPASRSSSKEGKKDSGRDKSGSPKGSGRKSEGKKSSRASSPKSVKGDKKESAQAEMTTPEPEAEPEEPAGPRTPQPGDEEWEFVDFDMDQALAYVLSHQWEGVESSYVLHCKEVFRQVRQERENIYRYFFQIRKDFLSYLRRPDTKQELVERWQRDYSQVPNDLREDEQTRAQLHQRVDALREKLWNICDERKDQAELERQTVMTDGWLDDRLGILTNHYITLLQAELDRLQDTAKLLNDYYKGMEGHVPEELKTLFATLPLMEGGAGQPESPKNEGAEQELVLATPLSTETMSTEQPSVDPGESKFHQGDGQFPPHDLVELAADQPGPGEKEQQMEIPPPPPVPPISVVRIQIPLVPRQGDVTQDKASSPTPEGPAEDKKGKKKSKPAPAEMAPPEEPALPPPQDPDEKFLFDAHLFAVRAIGQIMAEEMAAKQAEEDLEKAAEPDLKGKKGSLKASSAEESEEERMKETKGRMHHEHYLTVREEETGTRTRLELVKAISMAVVQDLKQKADNAFKDMNDWLGARFLKEMESIDTMSEVMRQAIEDGLPLKERIVLEQEDFLMEEDLQVLKTPSPLPVPEAVEESMPDHFTVNQLFRLFKQFSAVAPTGLMSRTSFVDLLENIVSEGGADQLPERWTTITQTQMEELARQLALGKESVDWRRFLMALLWPLPTPTQSQLLEALQNFRDMDQRNVSLVTREQFDRTALWFDTVSPYHDSFDRLTSLKKIVFDIFADHSGSLSKLDYTHMLLCFSVVPNSYEGFLRALSVATGSHMPRIPKPVPAATAAAPQQADPATELTDQPSSTLESIEELAEKPEPAEVPMMGDKIPMEAVDNLVPLEDLHRVLHHGEHRDGEGHRFSIAEPVEKTLKEKLTALYEELEADGSVGPLTLRVLMKQPVIQDLLLACKTFTSVDMDQALGFATGDSNDAS